MRASIALGMGVLLALPMVSTAHAGKSASLLASGANENAPAEVRQFGQLQGDWTCQGSSAQPDGSWQDSPNSATWSWYYVLDGHAVQDVWKPGAPGAPTGTNLRTYDAEAGRWNMVWATTAQARFDEFTATHDKGEIVMLGDRWARPAFPAHKARITFYNIGKTHYDWRYEVSNDGQSWQEQSRLSCDRIG